MNIRVDLNTPIYDGMEVVFIAPCDYAEFSRLALYYPTTYGTASQVFAFADAHANDLAHLDVLFAKDAVVKVILDTGTSMAFVQNADTNAYLEGRFAKAASREQLEKAIENIHNSTALERTANLFDFRKASARIRLTLTGDVEEINDNYFTTDYMPVDNVRLNSSHMWYRVGWYDENKSCLSVLDSYYKSYNIPSGTAFVRISYRNDCIAYENRNQLVVTANEKAEVLDEYIPYYIMPWEEHNGIVDYDNTWWKQASSSYKHIAIPINGDINIVEITGGTHDGRIAGVKSYEQPTSGSTIDFSDFWNKSIEIKAGTTLRTVIPADVKYLIVNTLYENADCVSELTVTNNVYSLLGKVENKVNGVRNQITISAQNVRDFNTEGGDGDGCPNDLVDTNLSLWKNHISKSLNSDFLCINEWYKWFDKAQTIDAYETIFKQFYPYKYELPADNPTTVLLSKHEGVMFSLADVARAGYHLPTLVCNIGGKSVAVVCWLESSSNTYLQRIESYNRAIPFLNAFDIVLVGGDFNTEDKEHFDDEMQVWKDAGYTIGNGGYWGKINTCGENPNDSIVVKGAIFEDFEVGEKITSDHNSVKAITSFIN